MSFRYQIMGKKRETGTVHLVKKLLNLTILSRADGAIGTKKKKVSLEPPSRQHSYCLYPPVHGASVHIFELRAPRIKRISSKATAQPPDQKESTNAHMTGHTTSCDGNERPTDVRQRREGAAGVKQHSTN